MGRLKTGIIIIGHYFHYGKNPSDFCFVILIIPINNNNNNCSFTWINKKLNLKNKINSGSVVKWHHHENDLL